MKRILFILTVGLLVLSCGQSSETEIVEDVYDCPKPTVVPDTMCGGTPIEWDCSWNDSYKNGNVILHRDSVTGCVLYVERILND